MKRAGFLLTVMSLAVGTAFTQTSLPQLQNWHGRLVDANCISGAGGSSPTSAESKTPQSTENSATQQAKDANAADTTSANSGTARDQSPGSKGHRSRKAPESLTCPATGSTNAFAVMLDDGRALKFDFVGNARVTEELKTKQKWTKEMNEGKPIHVKVSGTVAPSDTITVSDIH